MEKDIIKNLVEDYLTLSLWFCIHEDDNQIKLEEFKAVLAEIGRLEDELRSLDVSQTAINSLVDYIQKTSKTPIDQLPEAEQLRLARVIFGGETKWADDPHPPKQSLEKGESNAKTV